MGEDAKAAAVLAGSLVLAAACFQLVPDDAIAQGAVLAVLAAGAVALVDQPALARWGMRRAGRFGLWAGYVLAVGLACGIASVAAGGFSIAADAVGVVLSCLFTGVFEEGVFRVVALAALVPALGGGRAGLAKAAVVSSVLFGALHVSVADAASAGSAIAWAQALCKPLQAALFGLFMAALFVRTRSLWTVASVHGLFNVLYAGPLMLVGGVQATYVTGDPRDLVLLAASTLLLVPPAAAAWNEMRGRG